MTKIKNLLFWLFVAEHLLLLFFVLASAFFYVKTFAFSPFGELDKRAREFQPLTTENLFKQFGQKLQTLFPTAADGGPDGTAFRFSFTSDEISSPLTNLNLFGEVSKVYLHFGADDNLFLWVLFSGLDQPLMARFNFTYGEEEGLRLSTKDIQFGPIPIPPRWATLPEGIVNRQFNQFLKDWQRTYGIRFTTVATTEGALEIGGLLTPDFAAEKILPSRP